MLLPIRYYIKRPNGDRVSTFTIPYIYSLHRVTMMITVFDCHHHYRIHRFHYFCIIHRHCYIRYVQTLLLLLYPNLLATNGWRVLLAKSSRKKMSKSIEGMKARKNKTKDRRDSAAVCTDDGRKNLSSLGWRVLIMDANHIPSLFQCRDRDDHWYERNTHTPT